jgi:hypothetical protein
MWLWVGWCRVHSRAVVRLRVTIPNVRRRRTTETTPWGAVCRQPGPARVENSR